ncbi:MAG: hypothetical protein HC927_04875 [Deltaproteobacteria bacterium]|nr:hypothetical protein [Deltaproteobacteria bacterium]
MPGEDGFSFIRALRARPAAQGGEVPALPDRAWSASKTGNKRDRRAFSSI